MSRMVVGSSPWKVTLEREMIDVTMGWHSTPNEFWRATDSNGHEHRYDKGYPTLRVVVDRSHWCDGHEGMYNHDPHEEVDESHYECLLCGEVVEPAMDPPGTPKSIPGRISGRIEGPRSDGRVISAWLNDDEIAVVRANPEDPDVLSSLVDGVPEERITSWSFTR